MSGRPRAGHHQGAAGALLPSLSPRNSERCFPSRSRSSPGQRPGGGRGQHAATTPQLRVPAGGAACPRLSAPKPEGTGRLFPALLPAGTPAPLQPRGPGKGRPQRRPPPWEEAAPGRPHHGPPAARPAQGPPGHCPFRRPLPGPGPLSPSYVLSWLKLAKSRWPLPASPL